MFSVSTLEDQDLKPDLHIRFLDYFFKQWFLQKTDFLHCRLVPDIMFVDVLSLTEINLLLLFWSMDLEWALMEILWGREGSAREQQNSCALLNEHPHPTISEETVFSLV